MRLWGAFLIALSLAATLAPPRRDDQNRLPGVVELLAAEALLVKEGTMAMRSDASSFAERLTWTPEPAALLAAIARPQHADPFVDAYVRWQLTGLAGGPAILDDRVTGQLLDHLPRLVDNPRAEPRFVARLERAATAGALAPSELQRVRGELAAIEAAAARAEALNRAAEGFLGWVQERLADAAPQDTGHRPILLAARLAACVGGGWPSGRAKADLTRALSEGPAPAGPSRRRLEASLQRLAGVQRQFLEQVTFLADGSIRVDFATAAVADDDVERWLTLLAGSGVP